MYQPEVGLAAAGKEENKCSSRLEHTRKPDRDFIKSFPPLPHPSASQR